jgi:hypothetical protein
LYEKYYKEKYNLDSYIQFEREIVNKGWVLITCNYGIINYVESFYHGGNDVKKA